ncbi:putative RED-like N-terminal domain-containing protein [Seiridium unicorne]|uniref:RED-like N-terminal domain-containing protein n=1 Tax=Seiridium unicorne TaxID=138068 RepID=A0ABR2V503_9PEZI
MNNDQFRKLIASSAPKTSPNSNGASQATPRAVALGSRQRSSIPMTPRSVGFSHSDFQRQLAERNQPQRPQKRLKTSAPKGSKLAQGYTDRTKSREDEEADERAVRLKALEEALKKEEIDQATYDNLRSRIAGGDLESTHLVKGLDFKLLERVRKGEDVFGNKQSEAADTPTSEPELDDVDDVLDQLEETNVETITREAATKKGQVAADIPLKAGQKRSRAMILAELKAAREAAKAREESALGSRFKKIGDKAPGSRIEKDSKGREVLIIVDEDGNEKRKVRKVHTQQDAEEEANARDLLMPDKDAKPLGMEIPEIYRQRADEPEDDDVDIFDGVGDDYDPLAGLGEDSDSDSDEGTEKPATFPAENEKSADHKAMAPPPKPATSAASRNYFKDSKTGMISSQTLQAPSMSDPAIQAAFKKAAALNHKPWEEEDEEAKAKAERRKRMLESVDRDAEDMDMGFGTSRFEDEADFDESDVKLSQWNEDGDGDGGRGGGGKTKRKRGGKKRKGDVNNADDVMRLVEQRKAAK